MNTLCSRNFRACRAKLNYDIFEVVPRVQNKNCPLRPGVEVL